MLKTRYKKLTGLHAGHIYEVTAPANEMGLADDETTPSVAGMRAACSSNWSIATTSLLNLLFRLCPRVGVQICSRCSHTRKEGLRI